MGLRHRLTGHLHFFKGRNYQEKYQGTIKNTEALLCCLFNNICKREAELNPTKIVNQKLIPNK